MRDFTLNIYKELLTVLLEKEYHLMPYCDYMAGALDKVYILRHDVDRKPPNSLDMARIQSDLGVRGTYYFRIVPESFQPKYIEEIASLGHEIGYHYEDLTLCKGDLSKAIDHFERSLAALRKYAPVSTICMHGSPSTKWDNKDLWKHYSYRDFGIVAEPYFDIDFDQVYYLTDTGRMWDGTKYSVRDKVKSTIDFSVHSTHQLIEAVKTGRSPRKIMQNIHPERWTDGHVAWKVEYFKQKIKNQAKRLVISLREDSK